MIATWMLSTVLFTALVGAAAWFAECALRLAGRQARWPWLAVLGAAVAWPLLASFARRTIPESGAMRTVVTTLPTIQVVPNQLSTTVSWAHRLDEVLLTLWVVASVIVFARLVRSLVVLARIRQASQPRLVDGISVLVSEDIGPAVVGVVQPSVLLPVALLDLDEPLRRLVLRHEEEHRRARDPWIMLGSAFALALVPWNLPLWWIARRARLALEVDCDARVLASGANASQYGKLLLLISQRQTVTALAPMLAASNTHLERRITAMLPICSNRRRMRITLALVATIVAGIAACSSRISDGPAGPPDSLSSVSEPVSASVPSPQHVYFEFQVTRQARQIPGARNLRFPDSLRHANVGGEVLAQFVVDADGQIEPGSYKAIKSDHELFSRAVGSALPAMRFSAAEIRGTKVKQLVQQPFTFALSK
jgi:beta-lactamase regulating signal transducer with metallopeptidase domain